MQHSAGGENRGEQPVQAESAGEGGETRGPKREEAGEEREKHEEKGCAEQEPERLGDAQGRGEGAGCRGEPGTQALPKRREATGAQRSSAGEGSLAGRVHTQRGRAGGAAGRQARGRAPAGPCGRGGGAVLARISGYK